MSMILLLLGLIVLGFGLLLFRLTRIVAYPRTIPYQKTFEIEVEKGRIDPVYFSGLEREELQIKSPYGYKLHILYFPNRESKKTVILAHGITYSLFGSVKYMDLFYKRGFNVLIYDHRNHGKSGGKNTTYGYYEKFDLKAVTDWVMEKTGPDTLVGLHGESMGAAVVLQNLAIDDRITFCIADCPFSSLMGILRFRLGIDYHLPAFFVMSITSWIYQRMTGVRYEQVSPIESISQIEIPVFFIHGAADTYIPKEMSIAMYQRKTGTKKLFIAPEATHARSFVYHPEEYDQLVAEFLKEIGV